MCSKEFSVGEMLVAIHKKIKGFIETKKAADKNALIYECFLANGLSCLHKASLA